MYLLCTYYVCTLICLNFRLNKLGATEAVIDDLEGELSSQYTNVTGEAGTQQEMAAGLEKYYVVQGTSDKTHSTSRK